MKHRTHLILISAQSVPNLTPLLDENTKPQRVIMLVSPDMQQRADWLEDIISVKKIKIDRWMIANAYDIEHIQNQVLEHLTAIADDDIVLNATGGTKPMSIAVYEVFRDLKKPIFYVHPEQDRMIWLYPSQKPSYELSDKIKLKEFLSSYGATLIKQGSHYGVPDDDRKLTECLVQQANRWSTPLSILNAYAANAEYSLTAVIKPEHRNYHALNDLIELFNSYGKLSRYGHELRFNDESARFYVNGGWLEQHVYGVCLRLKKQLGIQDLARSLEIERIGHTTSVKNELDVAFLYNNSLYLIECKTHSSKTGHSGKNTDALYKLDSLKDLIGGLQAKAMLVSFTRLNKSDLQRASDLKINVSAEQDLANLPDRITHWLRRK